MWSFGISQALCVCMCVCSFFVCLNVSTRQLEPWPPVGLAGLPPMKAWEPSEEKKKKLAATPQEHGSAPSDTHIRARPHTRSVKGFTSPRPKQWSMPNFDLAHYLPRRWGLGWGDNLWTLTFHPEVWARTKLDFHKWDVKMRERRAFRVRQYLWKYCWRWKQKYTQEGLFLTSLRCVLSRWSSGLTPLYSACLIHMWLDF